MSFYCYMKKSIPPVPTGPPNQIFIEGEKPSEPAFPPNQFLSEGSFRDLLVYVQPMKELPEGKVFYKDFNYNSRWERLKRWIKKWTSAIWFIITEPF